MSRWQQGEADEGDVLSRRGVLRSRDVAELADTTPRALRHYHTIGLLPEVPRDANGYRRYGPDDLVRVLRIRQLSASGMPLRKIREVLEYDLHRQGELLRELDRELARQMERIEAQRAMLAELQRLSAHTAGDSAEAPAATRRLDHDAWTLMTATGAIDTGSAESGWYAEFERLETHEDVSDASADRMAERMASFAFAMMDAVPLPAAEGEQPIIEVLEQMQAERFSGAQRSVWNRFVAIIQSRWAAQNGED